MYPWDDYFQLGIERQSTWTKQLRQNKQSLEKWNKWSIDATKLLNNQQVISHRDLDPKNVMWHHDNPRLFDWKAAGSINPYQELIEVINYWCDDGKDQLNYQLVEGMINAYKNKYPLEDIQWIPVLNSGYAGMLGWLDYSFKSSLGIEASTDEEKDIGTHQVLITMEKLFNYEEKTEGLLNWFMR